jgi:hypothetical protein
MSITKSYNKQTGTYYAYETTYEWSDEKQKKVQRKRCIGKFDPVTGDVIPNGKVGRPSIEKQNNISKTSENLQLTKKGINPNDVKKLSDRIAVIEDTLRILTNEMHGLIEAVRGLSDT